MEALQGRGFLRLVEEFERLQFRTGAELRTRQEEKLAAVVRQAFGHVPFYRERFGKLGLTPDDIRSLDDLPKVPVLSRADVRRNFPGRMTAGNVSPRRRVLDRTSGSTGTPLEFYRDRAVRDRTLAAFLFFDSWAGIRPGDRTTHIGAPQPFNVRSRLFALLRGHEDIPVFGLDARNTDRILARLAKIGPDLIEGYASAVFQVALAALSRGVRLRPRAVVTTSDSLPAAEPVEEAFGCRAFNRYGNREICGALAQDCGSGKGLHVNTELCVLEVADDRGLPVPEGGRGRVLVTDLHNMVMPLIRYDTGDVAASGGECPCGRGFPLINALEGRSSEFLVSPRGLRISPVALGHFLFVTRPYAGRILKYQAEQRGAARVDFRFVPLGRPPEFLRRDLARDLRDFLGGDVDVRVEFVEDIPAGPGGKQRTVVTGL
jgi:phenylacetate-CoA ligase